MNVKVIDQLSRLLCFSCVRHLARIHEMSFAVLRYFVTARGSDWGYTRAVLSLGLGLAILSIVLGRRLSSAKLNDLLCGKACLSLRPSVCYAYIVAQQCEIGLILRMIANRKSHTGFQMIENH